MMATNWSGSALERQLNEIRPQSFGGTSSPSVVKGESSKSVVEDSSVEGDDDEWS